jgi:hypothetical protein
VESVAFGNKPWFGGAMPVPIGTVVHCKLKNGNERTGFAESFFWRSEEAFEKEYNIVSYEVIS